MLILCNVVATGDIGRLSANPENQNAARITLPVPYYDQGDTSWCIYACFSMMLNYNNRQVEPWEIASYFNSGHNETFEGQYDFFDNSLEDYFMENWSVKTKRTLWGYNIGNFDVDNFNSMIRNNVDRRQPVLLAFQYPNSEGTKEGHAVIAVGYDEEYIYLTDPSGAITEDFFKTGEEHIAAPVTWHDFNEKLVRNITPTNMAFTIEIMEDAPESSPEGSIYLIDNSDNNYSYVCFTDRFNANDVGLLRFDGKHDNGYHFVRKGEISVERKTSVRDAMSLYFTVANPTPEQKNYTVVSKAINKNSGNTVEGFFFSTDVNVESRETISKGINYSNQLEKISDDDYCFVLTLLDENKQEIDSLSIELYIPSY
ncbi:C39 family peptidase [Methanolobus sp. ZRKC2]|uniref:C39 family peptidase n=1 Tax=Methanolobus sp. ZRKC2 TaxID=3125783 RepID=UPI003253B7E2